METNRATFLAAAAGTAVIASSAGEALAAGTYDRAKMDAVLNRPARHRHIIGYPRLQNNAAMRSAAHIMGAFAYAFGEGPGTVNIVVALYGPTTVMMLANDEFWATTKAYDLTAALGELPQTTVRGPRNPFYHAHTSLDPHDDPENPLGYYHDYSVEALTKRGVTWFVCNEAMHTAARELERLGDGHAVENLAKLKAHLLPGTVIVPSGSQSLVVAQERHFTYQAA
jgi:intracellular sulfur oxidation DsrE/DsrF family protein